MSPDDAATAASPGSGEAVTVRDVVRRFGDHVAVDGVSLDVAHGEFVSLLGPSGCGKTTLLRIIAGLETLDAGSVVVAGRDITHLPAHRRPVNMVFQRYALFPHKTVAENVAFGLRLRRTPVAERRRRVEEMLALVRLPGYGTRTVDQLSGGQAQRVALARALVNEPQVLLLDEPLAALDLKLRQAMHIELRDLQRRVGSTFVYVTHDQEEALVMSDRIVLMDDGRIVQQGAADHVYARPRTLFAARFLGEANIFVGESSADGATTRVSAGAIRLVVPERIAGPTATVCVRPERVRIARSNGTTPGVNEADGVVQRVVFLGSVVRYIVVAQGQEVMVETSASDGLVAHGVGDAVRVAWDADACVPIEEAQVP